MKKIFFTISLILLSIAVCNSQTKPSLKFTVGFAFPSGSLNGDLVSTNDSGISFIDQNFLKENYAVSAGATLTGMLRFPLDKKGILSGNFLGSYSYFNAFRRSFIGTTRENNFTIPVSYDSRFTTSTFGVGIEISPSPLSKFSPFVNADFTLNILSLNVTKNDFNYAVFSDAFRMGLLTNAGVSIRINDEYSLLVTGGYHFANLLLKSNSNNFSDRAEFNRENIPINDKEGMFYSSLSNPGLFAQEVTGKTKNAYWWNLNIGLNIVLGKSNKK